MSLTSAQRKAVTARGNVLVVAGAGTGKTRTLVERCLHCLLEESPPVSIEEILVVTFTEAAATEMREKIREALNRKLDEIERPHGVASGAGRPEPLPKDRRSAGWLTEQLALFDSPHIGTLHSFCLKLLRQHFYELELDPQLTVMPEEEARLLADETLEKILEGNYAGKAESAEAVQDLIQTLGRGRHQAVSALVLRLHEYTQTLCDPEAWFGSQLAMFKPAAPRQWQVWLEDAMRDWRQQWLAPLEGEGAGNKIAAWCAEILRELPEKPAREEGASALAKIQQAQKECPHGKKTLWCKPLERFFHEARFLESVMEVKGGKDPLAEDWEWVRGQMMALLNLAGEFSRGFGEAKRELGLVDFHDLEQHALRLLRDRATGQPTEIARRWRDRLRFVFVDEYQDINDAQDAILKALSRDGAAANRFLVGDVKQSIYGFRLADPRIFQEYMRKWRDDRGTMIPLVDNFRSREAILRFVNTFFSALMHRETGGVAYDESARLCFGDAKNRAELSLAQDSTPRVELCLRLRGGEASEESGSAENELMNLEESGKEARLVAMRLRELKTSGHRIWDESAGAMRPVEWGDMAVLLRSPSGKAESFAREFAGTGVPLVVARSGFYDSTEVADLLSLLKLFDNPLQDLPALAVLRSPLVGMSLDELVTTRLAQPDGHIWTALQRYHDEGGGDSGWAKADRFLRNFAAWRRLARQISLSRCLEVVLDGTHYADWLLTQPRGEQRHGNVRRLLALAQQFDRFQRQGLFRFLQFVEAQQAAEMGPEVTATPTGNSVSLMSIHQSKGLEFPVVVVADLGKPFNLSDLQAEIILDEEYGLCPQIKPPHSGQRYPSLPWWLARRRQKEKSLGEEMRLLYVAMTRARDTLVLSGTASAKKFAGAWREVAGVEIASVLAARSCLDWIAGWAAAAGAYPTPPAGENTLWHWRIYDDLDERLALSAAEAAVGSQTDMTVAAPEKADWQKVRQRLAWTYPHAASTRLPAKTSVTALRRQFTDEIGAQELFGSEVPRPKPGARPRPAGKRLGLSATEIGTAHHIFLHLVSLEHVGTPAALRDEGQRLLTAGTLSEEQLASLDFDGLAKFWQSELGRRIRARAKHVRRELEFTTRISPREMGEGAFADVNAKAGVGAFLSAGTNLEDAFIVMQGAADLAVMLPEEIWLVDFKTDRITEAELGKRVKEYEVQLRLYARALGGIYGRPATEAWLHFLTLGRSVGVELKTQS